MIFKKELVPGKLIKRYKRFLTDVELKDGSIIIAHCTNSGSMKTCIEDGAPIYLSPADDPKRKTQFTWEMIYMNNGWIGINTMIPNLLVYEAIQSNQIEKLKGYDYIKREVKFGDSRFDVFAENEKEKCFIEVKNVTMKVGNFARFPDAKTTRGKKHLEKVAKGNEEVIAARFADANFFIAEDKKKKLEEYLPKLKTLIFHPKLGSMFEKTERIEKITSEQRKKIYEG